MIFNIKFSPIGGTAKVSDYLTKSIALESKAIDLMKRDLPEVKFLKDDLAIFSLPVYSGRIPQVAKERIEKIEGNGIRAVSVVVYGNRDYDDALIELNDVLKSKGFEVMASGAFIAKHSIVTTIAFDRPDENDFKDIEEFGQTVLELFNENNNLNPPSVKGKVPFEEISSSSKIDCDDNCILCGDCVEVCPVEAIPEEEPNTTSDDCIMCMACRDVCPVEARGLTAERLEATKNRLKDLTKEHRPNEMYYGTRE